MRAVEEAGHLPALTSAALTATGESFGRGRLAAGRYEEAPDATDGGTGPGLLGSLWGNQ